MPKVKICGITRVEDLKVAVEGGADYIGIILYPKSPRYVPEERRKELLSQAKGVYKVAVMVNPSEEEVFSALNQGFDFVQLHGEESLEFAKRIGLNRVIKAFRIKDRVPEISEEWKEAHAILLDTYSKEAYGGTGRTFNWDIAKEIVNRGFRVFLSGGLNPENVSKAIEEVKPYGVDVSSGVEREPGIKDKEKVLEFLRRAKKSF